MGVVTVGPGEVQAVCDDAGELLTALVLPEAAGSRQEWAAAAAAAQRVANTAAAVQDACIARLAAIEAEPVEDGTWVEVHQAPGHIALDCPAIVSGALTVTAGHAEHQVAAAVALAADGPAATPTHTGLGGLHEAMRAGRLDPYRAGVITQELQLAPPQVRQAVVTALDSWFEREDGPHLRRRTRTNLARISPDLLRQAALKARTGSGLRRWVDQPGIDTWQGTFPSEEAAHAWAAIDTLAQQYRNAGTCDSIERARAKALTDLVTGSSTVTYAITLTAPATLTDPDPDPDPEDLVEVGGLRPSENALVARGWLDTVLTAAPHSRAGCHRTTGALLHQQHHLPGPERTSQQPRGNPGIPGSTSTTDTYRPSPRMTALVKARDGRCRFPGCAIAARFCDLDHVRPWPAGPTHPTNLICLCRRHHRIKQRHGWHTTLHPDATTTWTDPTGRQRTTLPRDALHTLLLPTPHTTTSTTSPRDECAATSRARTDLPDGPHSHLELLLEHLTAAHPPHPPPTVEAGPPRAATLALTISIPAHHRPRRGPHATRADDPPPF